MGLDSRRWRAGRRCRRRRRLSGDPSWSQGQAPGKSPGRLSRPNPAALLEQLENPPIGTIKIEARERRHRLRQERQQLEQQRKAVLDQVRAACKAERTAIASTATVERKAAPRPARRAIRQLERVQQRARRRRCSSKIAERRDTANRAIDTTRAELRQVPVWRATEIQIERRRRAERAAELRRHGKSRASSRRRSIEAIWEHDERASRVVEGWRPELVSSWWRHRREFKGGTPEQRAERFIESYGPQLEVGGELWAELGKAGEAKAAAMFERQGVEQLEQLEEQIARLEGALERRHDAGQLAELLELQAQLKEARPYSAHNPRQLSPAASRRRVAELRRRGCKVERVKLPSGDVAVLKKCPKGKRP